VASLALLALLATLGGEAAAEPDLAIRAEDLALSQAIPVQGRTVCLRARIQNLGGKAARNVSVRFEIRPRHRAAAAEQFAVEVPTIEAGSAARVEHPWHPAQSGFYLTALQVECAGEPPESDRSNNQAAVEIAVVARPVVVAWYGHAKHLRWVTHLAHANPPKNPPPEFGDREYWQWRGCVADTSASVQRGVPDDVAVQQYLAARDRGYCGIAIDEISYTEEDTEASVRMARILEQTRREAPENFHLAAWFNACVGKRRTSPSTERSLKAVDLVLAEAYLFYRAYDPTSLYEIAANLRHAGVLHKAVLGLDLYTQELTPACVEAQFRHVKRAAPESPGVALFTYHSAAPGLAQAVDQLCRKYFVAPVLTLGGTRLRVDPDDAAPGGQATLAVTVNNCGAMPGHGGSVTFYAGDPRAGGTPLAEVSLETISAGGRQDASATVKLPKTPARLCARLAAPEPATILDDLAEVLMPGASPGLEETFSLVPAGGDLLTAKPQWATTIEKFGRGNRRVARSAAVATQGKAFTLGFDIQFVRTAHYGVVAVGVDSSRDRSELGFRVYRGDNSKNSITVSQSSADGAQTCRSTIYEYRQGRPMHVELSWNPIRQTFRMSVAEGGKPVWDSGPIASFGPVAIDRLFFAVRLTQDEKQWDKSSIAWEPEHGGQVRLTSITPGTVEATVRAVRLLIEQ